MNKKVKSSKPSGRSEENYNYNLNETLDEPIDVIPNHPSQEEIIDFNRKENCKNETINHPTHYGGEDNLYEAIKVIDAWELGFNLGNTVKYISRAGKKLYILEDLEKASWYINREINKLKNER